MHAHAPNVSFFVSNGASIKVLQRLFPSPARTGKHGSQRVLRYFEVNFASKSISAQINVHDINMRIEHSPFNSATVRTLHPHRVRLRQAGLIALPVGMPQGTEPLPLVGLWQRPKQRSCSPMLQDGFPRRVRGGVGFCATGEKSCRAAKFILTYFDGRRMMPIHLSI